MLFKQTQDLSGQSSYYAATFRMLFKSIRLKSIQLNMTEDGLSSNRPAFWHKSLDVSKKQLQSYSSQYLNNIISYL